MLALDFLRDPEGPGVRPIYAVFGDDAYLRREALGAISRAVLGPDADPIAVSRFDGEKSNLADVLDEVRTLPFLAKARLAIVEGADPFVTAHRKDLEAYAERPSSSGVLVLAVKSWPGSTRLARLVERTGLAVDCRGPAERDLPAWITTLTATRFGVKLERDAAGLLVELVGPEVGLLAAEAEKLAVYIGTRKTIQRDDVARIVGGGRVETIWKIVEAAATGQAGAALADLDRLLASGEYPVPVLAAIGSSLRKVYYAGQLRRARVEPRQACRTAGITHPAGVEVTLREHAHLGPARVARLPELLVQADLDLKGSSQLSPRVVLERLLVELARPRRD